MQIRVLWSEHGVYNVLNSDSKRSATVEEFIANVTRHGRPNKIVIINDSGPNSIATLNWVDVEGSGPTPSARAVAEFAAGLLRYVKDGGVTELHECGFVDELEEAMRAGGVNPAEVGEDLRKTYIKMRTDAVIYDAENSTSYRDEIEGLVRRADGVDNLTRGELRVMIEELRESLGQ